MTASSTSEPTALSELPTALHCSGSSLQFDMCRLGDKDEHCKTCAGMAVAVAVNTGVDMAVAVAVNTCVDMAVAVAVNTARLV